MAWSDNVSDDLPLGDSSRLKMPDTELPDAAAKPGLLEASAMSQVILRQVYNITNCLQLFRHN